MPGPGGPGGPLAPPQYLADQLTLFEPGRADIPTYYHWPPSMFFTFRHHCPTRPTSHPVLYFGQLRAVMEKKNCVSDQLLRVGCSTFCR